MTPNTFKGVSMISDEDIERVRTAAHLADIATARNIVLRKSGSKFTACCPFHEERTPSFQIDPALNLWHCFGCGLGGDVFDFVMRTDGLDFPDAVRLLADQYNIELTETSQGGVSHPRGYRERLKSCCKEAADFYHFTLMRSNDAQAAKAREYLSARGMNAEVCRRWNLGFAPGRGVLVRHLHGKGFTEDEMIAVNVAYRNKTGRLTDRFFDRLMFPIRDKLGSNIAFGGRVIGPTPPNTGKYINTSETPLFHKSANLFGIDKAKNSITSEGCVIVVEGYTDVIGLHEAGVTNAVATLGTALTEQHVKMLQSLRPRRIVYLFDGDDAGQKAADRAMGFIDWGITPEAGSNYIEFSVVVLPDNLDPADFVSRYGKEGMDAQLASAQPLVRFAIDRSLDAWDLTVPEQRQLALQSAASLLSPIRGSIVASDYANYIADRLGCAYEVVDRAMRDARPRAAVRTSREETEGTKTPVVEERHVETQAERIERECLCLIARHPRAIKLLVRARGKFEWNDPRAEAIAGALCGMDGEKMTPAQVVADISEKVDGSAAYLASGTIATDSDEEVSSTVVSLLTDLKEYDLMKKIRSGNALLKNPEKLSPEEYDDSFKRITSLQKELNELRAARTGRKRP